MFVALQGVALATPLNLQVVYKKYLVKNAKIASLQAQIDSLQAQAQAVSRWDNPILYVGYNNADVNNFFILDSSFMQSISVGLSQKFDVNGKRHTQKQVVQIERQKKILELEQLKQQIAINILSNAINVYKNTQKLALLKDALDNIENLLYRAKHSSNPDQIAIAKLEVIKAQWEIKQNDLQDSLADNKISISELTFNQSDLLSLAPSLIAFKPEVELKEIMETNRTIKIASLQNSQALKNITLAKKSFLEDINVTANYLFRSKIFDMFTIGIAIPLPIYGKQNNTLQQRREEHLVALNSLENIKNSVQHNARKLIKKLTQLQKNLANIEQILQASEHIVQIYKDNLPSSQGDYNSYYNAFNDTINTKLLQLETKSALATNYLALENLKGLQ
ncbi:heavy metal RND efflux outer membrane protein,CzcC family [Helicobacter bizzozeronii CIII-1]|uniref:Heavy metal RND efflux outer membrane protein,CzcC family n=2 Tax=Helicobacter bizzozeronii TaxID=56877 RepID=F8KSV2_HELBC|nr:heavy metal RND efflux outer membrane protein,CzcC family [Helicobacter bizzozeronii CIII-1]CCF81004.1 Heavy metal RND efflux outer membrane protein,CzcC family [Helicobacter bizzozeronii CCUG 35545]SFZ71545.1 OMP852 [Helicobacter bizzozeronii]